MTLNTTQSSIFLSAIFVFSSCIKSDSEPGTPPDPALAITSISPISGPGATLDTIKGTDFTAKDSVYFNGKCASIVSVSATQLVVKVPPRAGTGKVAITRGSKSATGPVFTNTGDTYVVTTLAGSGVFGSADGTGPAASFERPSGVAVDPNGNVYVADKGSNKIRKISPAGVVTTLAGSGVFGSTGGTGAAASFRGPSGVAVDPNGNVYVADEGNNKIRKISPAGAVTTLAGSGVFGSTDGTGPAASFKGPSGVAVDPNGNVYVADKGSNRIRKIYPTGVVATLAGSGALGFTDGIGPAASFSSPEAVALDDHGNVYVADEGNNKIRRISPAGVVTTFAGNGVIGFADGTGNAASFNGVNSITLDGNGFMYVADENNFAIRQVTPEGVVTLLAGVVGSSGTTNAPALNAKFRGPAGVAVDRHGNIFVADQPSNTIRKLTPQ